MQIDIIFNVRCHPLKWYNLLADQTDWNESGPKTAWNFTWHSATTRIPSCRNTTMTTKRTTTSKEPIHAKSICVFAFDFSLWFWFHLYVSVVHTKWKYVCVDSMEETRNTKNKFDLLATIECHCKMHADEPLNIVWGEEKENCHLFSFWS